MDARARRVRNSVAVCDSESRDGLEAAAWILSQCTTATSSVPTLSRHHAQYSSLIITTTCAGTRPPHSKCTFPRAADRSWLSRCTLRSTWRSLRPALTIQGCCVTVHSRHFLPSTCAHLQRPELQRRPTVHGQRLDEARANAERAVLPCARETHEHTKGYGSPLREDCLAVGAALEG